MPRFPAALAESVIVAGCSTCPESVVSVKPFGETDATLTDTFILPTGRIDSSSPSSPHLLNQILLPILKTALPIGVDFGAAV